MIELNGHAEYSKIASKMFVEKVCKLKTFKESSVDTKYYKKIQ